MAYPSVGCAAPVSCALRCAGLYRHGGSHLRSGAADLQGALSAIYPVAARVHLFHGVPIRGDCASVYAAASTGILCRAVIQGSGASGADDNRPGLAGESDPARDDSRRLPRAGVSDGCISSAWKARRARTAKVLDMYRRDGDGVCVHRDYLEADAGCGRVLEEEASGTDAGCPSGNATYNSDQGGVRYFGSLLGLLATFEPVHSVCRVVVLPSSAATDLRFAATVIDRAIFPDSRLRSSSRDVVHCGGGCVLDR